MLYKINRGECCKNYNLNNFDDKIARSMIGSVGGEESRNMVV